jgi:predicted GNAT family N-acyltransferase
LSLFESHFEIEIHPISRHFDTAHFNCGVPVLNEFLQKYARQNHDRNISKSFVAIEKDAGDKVLGYYTTIASEIKVQDLPPKQSKHLPDYPVPVARVGRLAVNNTHKGKKIGEGLLLNALNRVNRSSDDLGIYAVVVDAKDDAAVNFYHRYGFNPLSENPRTLFLPIKTVKQLFSEK